MEALEISLESILRRHFWIVPARTNRHDQWYKRTYQGWKNDNGNREPLILTSRTSKDEWTRELHAVATAFAKIVEMQADDIYKHQCPVNRGDQDKVFGDHVLDMPFGILGPECTHNSPLKPAMQRASYWTSSSWNTDDERRIYHRAISALLICEQTNALCYLAQCKNSRIKASADVEVSVLCSSRRMKTGWHSTIDQVLELMLALVILKSFPESLPLQLAYQTWVPFVFADSAATPNGATIAQRLRSELSDHGDISPTDHEARDIISKFQRILVVAQVLISASGMPAVDWKLLFANAFMHFLGFECWNREREGHSYLPCDLNVRKDGKWVQKMTGSEATLDGKTEKTKMRGSSDPLLMHEPRREEDPENGEVDDNSSEELGVLEAQEVAYGLKRSTKYNKKAHWK
jgi:hypothetical protein